MYFGHRFKLPVESPLPLRDQVCEIISEAAARNAIVHGQPLPSCRELSTQLGVSRNTVFSAYDRLVEIGLLISKDRSGYFLNPDSVTMAPRTGPDRTQEPRRWRSKIVCLLRVRARLICARSNIRTIGTAFLTLSFTTRSTHGSFRFRAGVNVCGWH